MLWIIDWHLESIKIREINLLTHLKIRWRSVSWVFEGIIIISNWQNKYFDWICWQNLQIKNGKQIAEEIIIGWLKNKSDWSRVNSNDWLEFANETVKYFLIKTDWDNHSQMSVAWQNDKLPYWHFFEDSAIVTEWWWGVRRRKIGLCDQTEFSSTKKRERNCDCSWQQNCSWSYIVKVRCQIWIILLK